MRPLLLLSVLLGCAKTGAPSSVGDLPADAVKLADSPALEHLAAALDGGADQTAADLFREDLRFDRAPDPSALLSATQAANAGRENDGTELRILSYNVALLQAPIFWVIPYRATPYLDERRPVLPDLILAADYDVVLLQEVWRKQDVKRFAAAGEAHGYRSWWVPRGRYNDGLIILVKSALIADGTEPVFDAAPYENRDPLENFPGPGIKRGWSSVAFTHPTLGALQVFDTHLLAWPSNWLTRMSEVRELGSVVAASTAGGGVAFVAGDMNGGSYYKSDAWVTPDGETETGWWPNTVSYAMLLHYGGLRDLFIAGRDAEGALLDVALGDAVVNDGPASTQIPGAATGWCDQYDDRDFTASDCNALYFQQYAGTEYPARMDHLMVADPGDRVFVTSSALAFTEQVTFGDLPPMEPSDHLGVEVIVRVAAP